MVQPNEVFPVLELSNDGRVRVFRRSIHDLQAFEGMEVDAYIIITDRYLIMLDTMLCPEDVSAMLQSVSTEIIGRSLLCINSHADWDHTWGNCYFTREHSAPIIAQDHCYKRMQSSEAHQELRDFQQLSQTFKNVSLIPPSVTFNQSLTIHDSQMTIELLHAPGHHLDQIVAWIPGIRLLLAFDSAEYPIPLIEGADCVPYMFTTLERLIALQPQRVLCSHGKTTGPDLLKQNLAYIREIEKRCQVLLQSQLPKANDLDNVPEIINYSFDEVVDGAKQTIDYTFYAWAHKNNCQAILQWLLNIL
jgi:glyoxylase-like metal-dependent hydrolase (beta-lactamase superfamily II)